MSVKICQVTVDQAMFLSVGESQRTMLACLHSVEVMKILVISLQEICTHSSHTNDSYVYIQKERRMQTLVLMFSLL